MQRPEKIGKRKKVYPDTHKRRVPPEGGKKIPPGDRDPGGAATKDDDPETVFHYPIEGEGGAGSNRPRTWPPPKGGEGYPEPETSMEVPTVIKKRRKGRGRPG